MSKVAVVAEYDKCLLRSTTELMREYARGSRVYVATDGEDLVKKVLEMKPDVVFVGCCVDRYPCADGPELVRRIRGSDKNVPIYVIDFAGGFGHPGLSHDAKEAGATEVVSCLNMPRLAEVYTLHLLSNPPAAD